MRGHTGSLLFVLVRSCSWVFVRLARFPHGRRSLLGFSLSCPSVRAPVWVAACSFLFWVCLRRFLHGRRSLLGSGLSCPSVQASVWVSACLFVFEATCPLRFEYSRIDLVFKFFEFWGQGVVWVTDRRWLTAGVWHGLKIKKTKKTEGALSH